MATADQSIKSLLKDLIDEIGTLLRQELRLAQAETSEKVTQVQHGAVAIVAGLLLAFSALLILLQALVVALSNVMAPWLATLVVGIVVAVIAFGFIKSGESNLKPKTLMPERTIRSVRGDKNMMAEKLT